MWRILLMAVGCSLIVLGGEAMVVDHVVLADGGNSTASDPYSLPISPSYGSAHTDFNNYSMALTGQSSQDRVFVPPEWSPWGLLSAGALTLLYATALPGRIE